MTALIRSTRAELLRLSRWPALWVLAATWLTLNVVFGYVFDYIAYRTGDSAGPNTGVPPRSCWPASSRTPSPRCWCRACRCSAGPS
jgi:ABC-2 type transport system permease protein